MMYHAGPVAVRRARHARGTMKPRLLLLAVFALAMPANTGAQGNDKAYCAQLIDLYRRYIQNAPGHRFDTDALAAIDQCERGNTEAGVPVLEKILRDNRFPLPGNFKP